MGSTHLPRLVVLLLLSAAPAAPAAGSCPCVPASLCRPLSPQPALSRPEVVAYHGSRSPKHGRNAWSATGLYNNGSLWRTYDWNKVTTIGLFADLTGSEGWELLCTAHKHKVRVLPWSGAAFGNANPIVQPYLQYRYQHVEAFSNQSYIAENAAAAAKFVVENGMDGILLDAEGLHGAAVAGSVGRLRAGLVNWAAQLRAGLDRALPGALLTWTVGPNATNDDYTSLNQYISFFQPMFYCLSGDVAMPSAAAQKIYYSSRSNDPVWALNMTMHTYTQLGIPKQKIVMLLPWFGSDFQCAGAANCSKLVWTARDTSWFGGQCGQALDGGVSYGQALALFENSTSLGHSVSPMHFDVASATNYYEWRNTTENSSGIEDGGLHQLWFDDPRSFGIKASTAVKDLELHGIGIWLPELVSSAQEAAAMWAAVPTPPSARVI